jgi:hypothetical protein
LAGWRCDLDSRLGQEGLESKGNAFGQAAEGGREKALPFHSGTTTLAGTMTKAGRDDDQVRRSGGIAGFRGRASGVE